MPHRGLAGAPRVLLFVIPILGLFAGPVSAQRSGDGGPAATHEPSGRWVEVEVPVEAVNEARRAAGRPVLQSKAGRETVTLRYQRPVERRWTVRDRLLAEPRAPSFSRPSQPEKRASDGSTVIEGLTIDDNGSLAETFNIPADPHGAAGESYVCHVVNVSIECLTKDGSSVLEQSLEDFFGKADNLFDPRVVYDPRQKRWVVLVLNKVDNGTASDNLSELFLAVSETSDPTGSWNQQTFDMAETISVSGSETKCWFDYPSVALDEEAIYVTGNYFAFDSESESGFCDAYLSIYDQGGIYSGGRSTQVYLGDPNEGFQQDLDGVLKPAFIYGGAPGGQTGTWLFQYSGLSDVASPTDYWLVTRVDDPLNSPSFSNSLVSWGNIDKTSTNPLPDAPQPGASKNIETNDRRALDFVWRNSRVWGTTTLVPPSGPNTSQATAFYGEVDVSSLGSPTPISSSNIGGEDIEDGAFTYYPSVAVDDEGNAVFGFSLSGPNTYAGAYVATRLADAGTLSGTLVAKEGVAEYVRTLGEEENRWGDYSGIEIDPTDGTVWAINQAALATGSCTTSNGTEECGRWGAYLVQFSADVLPVELARFDAVAEGTDAVLTWSTASETNNAGFQIEHRGPTATSWSSVAFVDGHGTSQTSHLYRQRVSDLLPGKHRFRLVQKDTDGSTTQSGTATLTIRPSGRYALQAPRPNPTSGRTELRLSVEASQTVRVALYNTLGRRVRTLSQRSVTPQSPLDITVNGTGLPAGLYFVRVQGETFSTTRRLTIVK